MSHGLGALIENLIEALFNEIVFFSSFLFRGDERLYHALKDFGK